MNVAYVVLVLRPAGVLRKVCRGSGNGGMLERTLKDAKPGEELPHMATGSNTTKDEGKDITQYRLFDDKAEH